jgi:hypothetical protein
MHIRRSLRTRLKKSLAVCFNFSLMQLHSYGISCRAGDMMMSDGLNDGTVVPMSNEGTSSRLEVAG